jgi:hypothetical protein
LGEFNGFTLICEENLNGGIGFRWFLCFWAGVRVVVVRRGDHLCVFCGDFMCLGFVKGGRLGLLKAVGPKAHGGLEKGVRCF